MKTAHIFALAFLGCLALLAPACHRRAAQAPPPLVILPPSQPEPAPAPPPAKPVESPPEEKKSEDATKPAPELVVPAPKRPAPRPAAPRPAAQETPPPAPEPAAPKPAPPRMTPRLSPAEIAEYQRATAESISLAEKNLNYSAGRISTAAQRDLFEKIRAFLAQAREASAENDWVRARNLAEKARVLSVELVNSL
jgi:outer membrane biosynthesis protein TonB